MVRNFLCGIATCSLVLGGTVAQAATMDLLNPGDSTEINGAIYTVFGDEVSGTGLIDSFVRIQGNDLEAGYNTDGTLEFETKAGAFTHSLQVQDLIDAGNSVTIGMETYYEFVLDINQAGANTLLSLDTVEIYLNGIPDDTGYPAIGSLIYDMDGAGDMAINLDYGNYSGSGRLDMTLLVPTSLFGPDPTQYIYLYSEFGDLNPSHDGFEEWAHKVSGTFTCPDGSAGDCEPPPGGEIPEPSTVLLLGTGLVGLGFWRRKQQSKE